MEFVLSSTLFSIFAFVILYLLLNKYAFGPLFGIMEKRREHVQNELKTAEQNRQASEKLLAEQKQAIQDARNEAYEMIEQAKRTSGKQAEDILQKAREEADRLKEEALRDIESEKNKAIAALRNQVSGMSVLIASKIIEKQVDEKSQKDLVEHYLKEVGDNR